MWYERFPVSVHVAAELNQCVALLLPAGADGGQDRLFLELLSALKIDNILLQYTEACLRKKRRDCSLRSCVQPL